MVVGKYDRFVQKYLKKTKRLKTLKEFEKGLDRKQKNDERKPVKLSFAIQKAPERKKIEKAPIEKNPHQIKKKEMEEKKTVVIPDKFLKIAKKFGLPEDHLEFFYDNRESFHFESMEKTDVHCIEKTCKFTIKASPKCLLEHMITAHNYTDIPCCKIDCSYVAFSQTNSKHHQSRFHGHGKKTTEYGTHRCPLKTLEQFEKDLDRKQKKDERKPVKLSFAIQKAPERKKIEKAPIENKPRQIKKKNGEVKKTVVIPDKFIKIAKKFGLPEEHLEFFYKNRDSFHWESMKKNDIHCIEKPCKFTVKASQKCLVEHMITAHNYTDIPCDKTDCSFVAFSQKNSKQHQAKFHGHGVKPTEYGTHPCPYSTCKVSFGRAYQLQMHLNVHQNRALSCSYCQYRNVREDMLQQHLLVHFNLKNFACDICQRTFKTNMLLNHHKKTVHTTDDFICVDCGFVAKKVALFNKHRSTCKERLKFSRIL
ncbi:unnamed protein product [Oikopleura dioica]|uniref:C2H2-type domain-containing protein n=1 Tax=Oikopleura dioica TaxID=34765 RepID=E4YDZ0_OIKDI|nr:unnamed protein product [Oikopleura dioica]